MAEKGSSGSGQISVETKHIFPIIKRWLYSDKEIFLREIVSNACDAITKLKRLISLGEVKPEDIGGFDEKYRVNVTLNPTAKTLTVSDNGIGMTPDELRRYINQIALSGALDFLEKYDFDGEAEGGASKPGMSDDKAKGGIIGHFGLGFYSAFMVSDLVEIRTKSYSNAPAVSWSCSSEGDFEMSEDGDRESFGTDVIMHINDENAEFISEYKITDILDKYCSFLPVEIYFNNTDKKEEPKKEGEEESAPEEPKPINEISPLWTKNPSVCEKDEYSEFYKKVFRDFKDPLFYIHINADYPLNFKGILYFPRINTQFDSLEGQVKLYYNQVFVADNIKEVIPEYLLMLKGVIDCPELPLNVSRSYLQNDRYVAKISAHIVKKVGDKLISLFTTERETYEGFWQDIKTFILYGCIRDHKLYDRLKDSIIYKTTDDKYVTIDEYIKPVLENAGETKPETVSVYYTNNPAAQSVYVNMAKNAGHEVVILENLIETQFISLVEMQSGGKKDDKDSSASPKIKFVRVDSEIEGSAAEGDHTDLIDFFEEATHAGETGKYKELKVEAKEFGGSAPAILTLSEQSRRMNDMMKQYRMMDQNLAGIPDQGVEETLIINPSSALVKKAYETKNKDAARHIFHLALLSKRELSGEELEEFLAWEVNL
ncbi:molecular chaperone HtpG [Clostridia bacterium]|nr:molecular chaperone HtpG [Clostridia bacterium]